jgi:hypothetical protein
MWRRAAAVIALVMTTGAAAAQAQMVVAKEGTAFYHWPGCRIVRDFAGVVAMNRGQAEARGFKPHPDCDPSKAPPDPAGKSAAAKPPSAPSVFVDAVGKYYHRERCARLEKMPKKVVLDAATARKYWPCPACKPPIRPKKS